MKLTKSQLKQIIKEELEKVLLYEATSSEDAAERIAAWNDPKKAGQEVARQIGEMYYGKFWPEEEGVIKRVVNPQDLARALRGESGALESQVRRPGPVEYYWDLARGNPATVDAFADAVDPKYRYEGNTIAQSDTAIKFARGVLQHLGEKDLLASALKGVQEPPGVDAGPGPAGSGPVEPAGP
tara:strand:+ start:17817 stop:18365 length:549 start_codon:yes stop_codon:yes gene_type:complete